MAVTPWIIVGVQGEKLEARWSTCPNPAADPQISGELLLAVIAIRGFSFDRRLLGLTALSVMSNVMEESMGMAEPGANRATAGLLLSAGDR